MQKRAKFVCRAIKVLGWRYGRSLTLLSLTAVFAGCAQMEASAGELGSARGPCTAASAEGRPDVNHPSGKAPPSCSPLSFRLTYIDDFNTRNSDWTFPQGFRYEQSYVGANVSVQNGIMRIVGRNSGNGTTVGWAQLTAAPTAIHAYGKYLVRMRAGKMQNLAIAALLWPVSKKWPHDGEVDFAEDHNGGRHLHAFSHYADHSDKHQYTVHESPASKSGTDWHTWGVEWTPNGLTYTLDGEVWARETEPAAVPKTPMYLGFVMACHQPCPKGEASWEVDWVAVYKYAP